VSSDQMPTELFPIAIRGVTAAYVLASGRTSVALSDVDIPFVCRGQRIFVSGLNGAGKTTLVKPWPELARRCTDALRQQMAIRSSSRSALIGLLAAC
jgi:ABC-type Mn2+/Zn2+ transport system ATPase subunit